MRAETSGLVYKGKPMTSMVITDEGSLGPLVLRRVVAWSYGEVILDRREVWWKATRPIIGWGG
jgi:hypothetical protein